MNGISPEVLAQFQANGWVPPASATAPNVGPAPQPQQPPAPDMLHPAGDIYNSPQMMGLLLQQPAQCATSSSGRAEDGRNQCLQGAASGVQRTGESAWKQAKAGGGTPAQQESIPGLGSNSGQAQGQGG